MSLLPPVVTVGMMQVEAKPIGEPLEVRQRVRSARMGKIMRAMVGIVDEDIGMISGVAVVVVVIAGERPCEQQLSQEC